ncbi:hypothetical protein [Lentzea rhizosphaerae]|uniref:hypothetical protein n=1 Tax=Lentzea rhizosphaerae TaxID=2041025 RepID=UPI0036D29865
MLSLELVTALKTRHSSFSDFLRSCMAEPDAPSCIAGDPAERLTFDNAKRAMSTRLGRLATEVAEWEFVEFLVRHCGPEDTDECRALRTRLAGFWLASQRYPPPGYRGPINLPDGAPRPYTDADEAPSDKIRVIMLRDQLSQERVNRRRADDCEGPRTQPGVLRAAEPRSAQRPQAPQGVRTSADKDHRDAGHERRR